MSHQIGKKEKRTNKEISKSPKPEIIHEDDMKKHKSKGVIDPQ